MSSVIHRYCDYSSIKIILYAIFVSHILDFDVQSDIGNTFNE